MGEKWYLEQSELAKFLDKEKFMELIESCPEKLFTKGKFIYMPETKAEYLYVIKSGVVKIGQITEDGKQETSAVITKGQLFGEMAISENEEWEEFAQAETECMVLLIKRDTLLKAAKGESELSIFLMRLMSRSIIEKQKKLESLFFLDSKSRIYDFILNLTTEKGQKMGYEWVIRIGLTHQDIADITGTSRQTVSTTLNELKEKKIIDFDRKRIVIRDLNRLKSLLI
jgi:CRP/FNR family transcriptional regulator, cyclic AMP receptor protein